MIIKKRVLVLCTGNSCRSQMAEGLIRDALGECVDVYSAGTHPCYVHPLAIKVMKEAGIDISGHRSKQLSEFVDKDFDMVITLCDSAKERCPIFPYAKMQLHESIPDPIVYAENEDVALGKYREIRDIISEKIINLIKREFSLT